MSSLYSALEITLGITCACMPTMKPIFSQLFPRFLSTNPSKSYETHMGEPMPLDDVHADRRAVGTKPAVRTDCVGNENSRVKDVERGDIFVTTSICMTQDVDRKSEMGSEKDLIFQSTMR